MALHKGHFVATALAIAGCSPVAFRNWRSRNRLFAGTAVAAGGQRFSEADICALRLVVVLQQRGLRPQAAVNAAMSTLQFFERMWTHVATGKGSPHLSVICISYDKGRDAPDITILPTTASLAHTTRRMRDGVSVLVDLQAIVRHVVTELGTGDYPSLAPRGTAMNVIAGTLAATLMPRDEA